MAIGNWELEAGRNWLSRALGPFNFQFLAYAVAGSIAAVTHIAVLAGLVELVNLPATLASGIGFCCAVPVNYGLQHRYVFASKVPHRKAFFRYLAVTLAALALNLALFHTLLKITELHYTAAQILVIGLVFVVNFLANRAYSFAGSSDGLHP
ncbi:MAG: GtrA family protein [Pseudomonadota bacterium]